MNILNFKNSSLVEDFNIPFVEKRRYWIVRTSGGQHYTDFTLHNYIAIGWDYMTLKRFENGNEETLRKVIETHERINPSSDDDYDFDNGEDACGSEAAQITSIYTKLKRFIREFSIGDVVLVPSRNSQQISIGIIKSSCYENPEYVSQYLEENPDTEISLCPFSKRRDVEWIKHIPRSKMDMYLLKAFSSHHSISKVDDAENFINRNIFNIYATEDQFHTIIHANHPDGMSFSNLKSLVDSLDEAMQEVSKCAGIEYNPDNLDVKLNIHSPGLIEISTSILEISAAISIVLFSINHFRHGGKFSFTIDTKAGNGFSCRLESENKGSCEYKIQEQHVDIESIERLAKLKDTIKIEYPNVPIEDISQENNNTSST